MHTIKMSFFLFILVIAPLASSGLWAIERGGGFRPEGGMRPDMMNHPVENHAPYDNAGRAAYDAGEVRGSAVNYGGAAAYPYPYSYYPAPAPSQSTSGSSSTTTLPSGWQQSSSPAPQQ